MSRPATQTGTTPTKTLPVTKNRDWPGWRGQNRDGRVAWLPDTLPPASAAVWTAELPGDGIGGISAASNCVIVGSRDLLDRNDVFQCFDASDGTLLWQHFYPAPGSLDYGNSQRATPLIHEDLVFTLGAFGHLYCLELESGIPLWNRNLAIDFDAPKLTWGYSGSPLITDGKLIVQPGGRQASVVALDPETGEVVWETAGSAAGYSSFIAGNFGGRHQIIGSDAMTVGGWDSSTGQRLWTLIPREKGDFNVPTAVPFGNEIILTSENNGTRRYRFSNEGMIERDPVAVNDDLSPDSHTPVVSGKRIFGIWDQLIAIDPEDMSTVTSSSDDAFATYGCLIASDDRLLSMTATGQLILMSTEDDKVTILSRQELSEPGKDVLAHPAIAGDGLYVRIGRRLIKLRLTEN